MVDAQQSIRPHFVSLVELPPVAWRARSTDVLTSLSFFSFPLLHAQQQERGTPGWAIRCEDVLKRTALAIFVPSHPQEGEKGPKYRRSACPIAPTCSARPSSNSDTTASAFAPLFDQNKACRAPIDTILVSERDSN